MLALKNGHKEMTRRPFVALTVETWPDALRYCRVERGFSYADIARSVCKDRPSDPRSWEGGEGAPDKQDLRRLYYALPKLRNYAHLLPDDLKHEPAKEPTGEEAPPEALVDAAQPHKQIKDPTKASTFGAALAIALELEGMNHTEFSTIMGFSPSTISSYVANGRKIGGKWQKTSMIQATYDRILDLLPILKEAPKPVISERTWNVHPGNKPRTLDGAPRKRKGEEDEETEASPRAMPALPAGLGHKPKTIVVTPPKFQLAPATKPAKRLLTPEIIKTATDNINKAGAAYGVAVATVARLEAELESARVEVETSNRRLMWAIAVLKGEADPDQIEPSS